MNGKIIDFHTHVFPDKIANKTIEHLSKKGAAILVEEKELESGKLLEGLKQLVDNRDLRKKLAEKAKKQGTEHSEKAILKECAELVKS